MGLWIALLMQAAMSRPPVVHASREDCEIIVEIGKAKVAWGAAGPDEPFAIDGVQPDGSTYREDCPWADLGVGAPTAATYAPGTHDFGIDKPVYSPDGKTATARLNFVVINEKEGVAPFASGSTCTLVKVEKRWKLQDCIQNFIT
jgi:hypothetical protein